MEYYCHVWTGAPSLLELLDELQNGYALLDLSLPPLLNP